MWQYGMKEVPLHTLRVRPSGHPDYSRLIDPEPLRPLVAQIITPYLDPRGWTVAQASAIFDYVKRTVAYDYPKAAKCHAGIQTTVLRPSYTLELGRGICTDQAVLVSSLFAARVPVFARPRGYAAGSTPVDSPPRRDRLPALERCRRRARCTWLVRLDAPPLDLQRCW